MFDGVGGGLGARRDPQFGVDVLDVGLRGARADEQPCGDLAIRQAFAQQPQHLHLLAGQPVLTRLASAMVAWQSKRSPSTARCNASATASASGSARPAAQAAANACSPSASRARLHGALVLTAIAGNGGADGLAQRLGRSAQARGPLALPRKSRDNAQPVQASRDAPAVAIVPVEGQGLGIQCGRLLVITPVARDPAAVGECQTRAERVAQLPELVQRLGKVRICTIEVRRAGGTRSAPAR